MLNKIVKNEKSSNKLLKGIRSMYNKRGQTIMIQLLFLFMTFGILIALIPSLNTLLNLSQQSDYLNCQGYYLNGNVTNPLSYNVNLPSNTFACLAIRLYLPYLIVAILIGTITKVLSSRLTPEPGGYGI